MLVKPLNTEEFGADGVFHRFGNQKRKKGFKTVFELGKRSNHCGGFP
jgi:hypothetical protein